MSIVRHVVFRGRVQGVGFRAFVEDEAVRHGVEGWVRNRRDGTVEAMFGGPEGDVTATVETCSKGPPGARVEAVEVREASMSDMTQGNPGKGFEVRPTV